MVPILIRVMPPVLSLVIVVGVADGGMLRTSAPETPELVVEEYMVALSMDTDDVKGRDVDVKKHDSRTVSNDPVGTSRTHGPERRI